MKQPIQWVRNINVNNEINQIGFDYFNLDEMEQVRRFHRTIPQYSETPLRRLEHFANELGLNEVYVKDESSRFGLNAFKVLGASYAICKRLAQTLNQNIETIDFGYLQAPERKAQLPDLKFAAATDGNHGKGVAWVAKQLGYPATIHMPKGTTPERCQNIRDLGSEVVVTDRNYDDTVNRLAELADAHNWLMIQDTECLGCREVPLWIMQGYGTMAVEVLNQLNGVRPTHIFLQAGVGAFAAVMTFIFKTFFKEAPPLIIIVEPDQADCFYRSIRSGREIAVTDAMNSIMAGLCCGVPNPVSWQILKEQGDYFVSAPDWVTANGMRILGNPLPGDPAVTSGESGAVAIGLLAYLAQDPALKTALQLDGASKVVTFSTEGDTDQTMYRRIVWYGAYPDEREAIRYGDGLGK